MTPAPPPGDATFEVPVQIRYLEADQQGVVFNMWYLAYFDDALSAFLARGGLTYPELMASGFDVQLVHSEIDWTGSLRYGDEAAIGVELTVLGTTSFTLAFTVRGPDAVVATGSTVYVVVGTDGSGKRAVPDRLRNALHAGGMD
jgi:acyl-CoA thioester hydrolase